MVFKRFTWNYEGKTFVAEVELTDAVKTVKISELPLCEHVAKQQQEEQKIMKPRKPRPVQKKPEHKKGLKEIVKGGAKLLKSELGLDRASEETIASRRSICEGCPQFDFGVCNSCGCYLAAKVRLTSEKCPEGKW